MHAKRTLISVALMSLLLLPGLTCSLAWALAVQPGPPLEAVLPLLPGRTLEIDIQPCAAADSGRLMVWFVDTTQANRFVREHYVLLLRTAAAPPCP